MTMIQIPEPNEEERKEMDAAMLPYRKQITETPALLSLLYDIDLLPEQIRLPVNVARLIAFCEVFKRLTPEAIQTLFEPTSHTSA
jgi:hypothetical protein